MENRSPFAVALLFALGLAAIFALPFAVPGRDGISFSYALGFNNKAAIVTLLLVACGIGLWSRGLGLSLPEGAPRASFPATLSIALAITLFACLIVGLSNQAIVIGEANYFVDRLTMFQMGRRVYRDFTFDYGPIMFYLPVWISRIVGISLGSGYFVGWTLQWAAGTWALWKTIAIASRGAGHGRIVFLLFWAFWLSALLDGGTNYTPFRFCASLLAAVVVERMYSQGVSLLRTFGTAAAASVCLVFFSPEQGISFSIGTLIFFLAGVRGWRTGTSRMLALFGLTAGTAVAIAFGSGVLDSVLIFGGGALDFPVLPTVQTIVILSLLIVAACITLGAMRTGRSLHPLVYLICVTVPNLPAALGRADVGHIIINCEGALLATLIVLSQYPKVWRLACPSFATVVVLAWQGHQTFQPFLVRVVAAVAVQDDASLLAKSATNFAARLAGPTLAPRLEQFRAWKSSQLDPRLPKLPNRTKLLAPLGFARRVRPLPGGVQVSTGKYAALIPFAGSHQLFEKIDELRASPEVPLVLPVRISCEQAGEIRDFLKAILVAPYVPPVRNRPINGGALCAFISTAYRMSDYAAPVPGYTIWVRKLQP